MLDGHVKLPAGSGISIVDDEDEKERYVCHTPLRRLKLTVTPPPPLCTLCGDRQPVQPLVLGTFAQLHRCSLMRGRAR